MFGRTDARRNGLSSQILGHEHDRVRTSTSVALKGPKNINCMTLAIKRATKIKKLASVYHCPSSEHVLAAYTNYTHQYASIAFRQVYDGGIEITVCTEGRVDSERSKGRRHSAIEQQPVGCECRCRHSGVPSTSRPGLVVAVTRHDVSASAVVVSVTSVTIHMINTPEMASAVIMNCSM